MALDTVMLAVGPNAGERTDTLTTAVLEVAESTDTTVVLLHVFSQTAYEEGIEQAGYDPENPPPAHTLASRLESIDEISVRLEAAGVDYRIRGEIGPKNRRIIEAVEATDTDMLLVSGRRRSPTGKAVFGSTVHEMLTEAPCLVTFVRRDLYESEE
jgi:nucleotide-binding universal stress UspA family protein